MKLSDEQREQVLNLLREGRLTREEIGEAVAVSPGTVSAIKAHLNMGTYGGFAAPIVSTSEAEELIDAAEVTFGLERDLQRALRANIHQLEAGLQIVDSGKERITKAGNIDITAKDSSGKTVVIELKAGEAAPAALTQLLAYMGAVGTEDGGDVRGILIASEFHSRVVFAVQAVPNVALRKYGFKFTFDAV